MYWAVYILTWGALPFLNEFISSGEFTREEKIKKSLESLLRFYLFAGIPGIIFFVILIIKNQFKMSNFILFLK